MVTILHPTTKKKYMETEVFKQIPGYPLYRIGSFGTCLSYRGSSMTGIPLRPSKLETYRLIAGSLPGQKARTFGMGKLIYAAFNGIRPDDIDGFIIGNKLDTVKLLTKEEFYSYLQTRNVRQRSTPEEVMETLLTVKSHIDTMIHYHETNHGEPIFDIVYSHKDELKRYARNRRMGYSEGLIEEAVSDVLETCVVNILSKTHCIVNIPLYFKKLLRTYIAKENENKRMIYSADKLNNYW